MSRRSPSFKTFLRCALFGAASIGSLYADEASFDCEGANAEIAHRETVLARDSNEIRALLLDLLEMQDEANALIHASQKTFDDHVRAFTEEDPRYQRLVELREAYEKLEEEALARDLLMPSGVAAAIRTSIQTPSGVKIFGIPFEAMVFDQFKAPEAVRYKRNMHELLEKYEIAKIEYESAYEGSDVVRDANRKLAGFYEKHLALDLKHAEMSGTLSSLFHSKEYEHVLGHGGRKNRDGSDYAATSSLDEIPGIKSDVDGTTAPLLTVKFDPVPADLPLYYDGRGLLKDAIELQEEQLWAEEDLLYLAQSHHILRIYDTARMMLAAPFDPVTQNMDAAYNGTQGVGEAIGNSVYGVTKMMTYDTAVGLVDSATSLGSKIAATGRELTPAEKQFNRSVDLAEDVYDQMLAQYKGSLDNLYKERPDPDAYSSDPKEQYQYLVALINYRKKVQTLNGSLGPLNERFDQKFETVMQATELALTAMGVRASVKLRIKAGQARIKDRANRNLQLMADSKRLALERAKVRKLKKESEWGLVDDEIGDAADEFLAADEARKSSIDAEKPVEEFLSLEPLPESRQLNQWTLEDGRSSNTGAQATNGDGVDGGGDGLSDSFGETPAVDGKGVADVDNGLMDSLADIPSVGKDKSPNGESADGAVADGGDGDGLSDSFGETPAVDGKGVADVDDGLMDSLADIPSVGKDKSPNGESADGAVADGGDGDGLSDSFGETPAENGKDVADADDGLIDSMELSAVGGDKVPNGDSSLDIDLDDLGKDTEGVVVGDVNKGDGVGGDKTPGDVDGDGANPAEEDLSWLYEEDDKFDDPKFVSENVLSGPPGRDKIPDGTGRLFYDESGDLMKGTTLGEGAFGIVTEVTQKGHPYEGMVIKEAFDQTKFIDDPAYTESWGPDGILKREQVANELLTEVLGSDSVVPSKLIEVDDGAGGTRLLMVKDKVDTSLTLGNLNREGGVHPGTGEKITFSDSDRLGDEFQDAIIDTMIDLTNKGIYLGDINPGNIFFRADANGDIKVTFLEGDFARRSDADPQQLAADQFNQAFVARDSPAIDVDGNELSLSASQHTMDLNYYPPNFFLQHTGLMAKYLDASKVQRYLDTFGVKHTFKDVPYKEANIVLEDSAAAINAQVEAFYAKVENPDAAAGAKPLGEDAPANEGGGDVPQQQTFAVGGSDGIGLSDGDTLNKAGVNLENSFFKDEVKNKTDEPELVTPDGGGDYDYLFDD